MQNHRHLVAGRRTPRPLWLVTGDLVPRRRPSPISGETALIYENALAKAVYLKRYFPDFYRTHIADRQLTPRALLAVVCTFLSLVNRDLFQVEDCMVLEWSMIPLQNLAYTEDDALAKDALSILEEAHYWLERPRPEFYGIGIEGMLEDETPQCALTLALWKLCSYTEWSVGVDVADVIGFSTVSDEVADLIRKLHPLPAGVDMIALCEQVDISGVAEAGQLIRYAFARTGNPMANITNYEIDVVYNGEVDDTWNDVPAIAEHAAAAISLVQAYGRWADRIDTDPKRSLRQLSKAMHDAAIASVRRRQTEQALIDILVDRDRLADIEIPDEVLL